jgi:SurA N-terminal domain
VNPKIVVICGLTAAVAALTTAAIVIAQSGSDAATQSLNVLATKGADTAVVAIVNGRQITRRSIDMEYALALQGSVDDAAGRPTANLSKDELLSREVENVLLAQAAQKAGVVVTDNEVSLAIQSGLIDPLSSPSTDPGMRQTGLAALQAAGVSISNVETDPTVRTAYRDFELIQRYASTSKESRDARLAAAKSGAEIQTFPDVLNAPH